MGRTSAQFGSRARLRGWWVMALVAIGWAPPAYAEEAKETEPPAEIVQAPPPPSTDVTPPAEPTKPDLHRNHPERVPQSDFQSFAQSLENAHVMPPGLHWDEGLWLHRKRDRFTMRLNWRMDIDYVGVNDDKYVAAGGRTGNTSSGMQMRRARLTVRGDLGRHSYYKASVEATDASAGLRDFFWEWRRPNDTGAAWLPVFKVGNFFEPYSLEQQTPSSRLTFMSRSASTLSIGLGRAFGVMAYDTFNDDKWGYALGAFVSPLSSLKEFGDRVVDETLVRDGYGVTGRVWWMPWGDSRGICKRLLVGASFSRRIDMTGIQFRARPESHKFDFVIDTDFSTDAAGVPLLDDASTAYLTSIEAAWQNGAFGLQGEYYWSRVKSVAAANPLFHGGYVQASYWLTGECRTIARGGVQPMHICNPRDPCKKDSGWGGVELAARYTTVNLIDGNVYGGEMHNLAFGVNWHLAERRRLMLNVVRAQVDDGIADEPIWILQTRLQLEF